MAQWRSKSYTVRLSPKWRLSLTLRRFKAAKPRRASHNRQLIINLRLNGIRQIAVGLQANSRPKRKVAQPAHLHPYQAASRALIAAGSLGVGIFGISLINAPAPASPEVKTFSSIAAKSTTAVSASLPYSEPTHIAVPDVGIDADIISVGLASDGSMETPPLFSWVAGWYRLGPTPGQLGPAIIVGHLDTYQGGSVFWRLREVQPGSMIHITRADGKVAKFRAVSMDQYDQNNFPTDEVYGNLPYAGLRLITCGGAFDPQTLRYTENTVVSAVFIPEAATPPSVAESISDALLPKPKSFVSYITTSK